MTKEKAFKFKEYYKGDVIADGHSGHQHCRDMLAELVQQWCDNKQLANELRGDMSDDASEEDEAIELLNEMCEGDLYFEFNDGDILLQSEVMELAREKDIPFEIVYDLCGVDGQYCDHAKEMIEENYTGQWDSLKQFGEDQADNYGVLDEIPEHLKCYFDMESYANDLQMGGDISVYEDDNSGYLYIFWSR